MPKQLCVFCGKEIPKKRVRSHSKYCTNLCRRNHYKHVYHIQNPKSKISTSTKGAVSELTVAVDLLKKGYHVFRSMSPSSVCDFAIIKNDKFYKLEVTTGYRLKSGKVTFPPHDSKRYTLLAVVCNDSIIYDKKI